VTKLLLDTNVLLWLLFGDREAISARAEQALTDTGNAVSVSSASVWEIAIKRSRGRLRIGEAWPLAITALGFDAMPVTALHAQEVERLPWHHRDPFDRLLVAQAAVEDHRLVSADARMSAYGVDVIW
jgi:PIN domain nuclease of toxin-antitoxin system